MPGTVGFSDIYGGAGPGVKSGEMPPPASQQASGATGPTTARSAWYWAALVGLLVVVRLLWEKG